MHIAKELVKWIVVPALLTIALIGGVRLGHDMITYQHTITGQAHSTEEMCIPDKDELFNSCARLDTSQVIDLRS